MFSDRSYLLLSFPRTYFSNNLLLVRIQLIIGRVGGTPTSNCKCLPSVGSKQSSHIL
jgi:hypothetical protein